MVTEVPWAQGRNALPRAVRPEGKWALLRHHAGVGGLACRLGTRDAIGLRNAVDENEEVSRRLARAHGGPWRGLHENSAQLDRSVAVGGFR